MNTIPKIISTDIRNILSFPIETSRRNFSVTNQIILAKTEQKAALKPGHKVIDHVC